jgi:hypothetical protein
VFVGIDEPSGSSVNDEDRLVRVIKQFSEQRHFFSALGLLHDSGENARH